MIKNHTSIIEQHLKQIAEMLILNGTLTECPGLVHGKMGISLFFFHYAQYTGNGLFADYAMDVIGEILDQIHINSPADYEKGIAGIGVGIDYLIQHNFLNVEDDICEDLDTRMIRAVKYDPYQDFSQYSGLIGYGRYWIKRLYYQSPSILARECLSYIIKQINENLPNISVTEQIDVLCFLLDLQKIFGFNSCINLFERCQKEWDLLSLTVTQPFPRLGDTDIGNSTRIYYMNKYFNDTSTCKTNLILEQIPDLNTEKVSSTGFLNGYAGEGMLRLAALDQTNISWMNLL